MDENLSLADRLAQLLDHLGIDRAHFATQMPGDLAELAMTYPARIAGLVFCVPTRLDPGPFTQVADRLTMISDEHGMSHAATERAQRRLPNARRQVLAGYDAPGWADVVADKTHDVCEMMRAALAAAPQPKQLVRAATGKDEHGEYTGITYRIAGSGPPLVLLPFFLAPSQWEPAMPELSRHFTVIRLGGAHVGGVAALEDRARAPSYRAMFRTLIDIIAPKHGERIADVGCGSGALDRLLAERLGDRASPPIEAVDLNAFLLGEAAALATTAGVSERIRFTQGSAEALPFGDASIDCLFSVTVLEECDADKAIAEMRRVVRPGGRIGIIVRSIDMPQWWSFNVPENLRARASLSPQSVGRGGVADASLYRRMQQAGLTGMVAFPSLVTLDRPDGPIWRYREDHVLSQLTAD